MALSLHHKAIDREAALGAVASTSCRPVGLDGVLGSLNRQARLGPVPGRRVEWGFSWEPRDVRTRRWWPQGITTAGEAGAGSAQAGRPVLLTSWYARGEDGSHLATRISVVDLASLRYRHVLLVQPRSDGTGWRPLRVHAGGLAWSGDRLLVAATRRGLCVADLGGVLRVQRPEDFHGHRFVLPVTAHLRADQGEGTEQLRYSFCSVERDPAGDLLHVGEYGRGEMSRRLVRFPLDPATGLPGPEAQLLGEGPTTMQGVVVLEGRHHLTSSHGTRLPGTLHVGRVGTREDRLRSHRAALPPGPEDLTWWPEQGLLWSLSEHPGARFVFAVRPAD